MTTDDPRAALAEILGDAANLDGTIGDVEEYVWTALAERGVRLVTEEGLARALLNAGWRNAVGDAAAIFAALSDKP